MATLKSNDFSKFERFSNVVDRIIFKIISSFQESDLLVIVPKGCDFELSIKSAERLRHQENLVQEMEIISNRKVPKSFQSYLSNVNSKKNLVNYMFEKWKKILSEHLSSYKLVYLANLDGTIDCITKECSKRIEFTVTTRKLTQKNIFVLY